MTSRSTIVGITRQSPGNADTDSTSDQAHLPHEADDYGTTLIQDDSAPLPAEPSYDDYYDEDLAPTSTWKNYIIPSILSIALALWTGYFIWSHRAENILNISNERMITLLGNWSLPAVIIGLLWLIAMRSSRAEAYRFSDISAKLRVESDALEARMRTVNEEIALAREFLSQNALELESIGRHSAAKLTEAAQQLSIALSDSDQKAQALEAVSSAAASNLDQLRKQLPVVTSAAKDVTNQIGNAGNSAQLQVKTLIGALHKVAEAGTAARESVDGMGSQAEDAAQRITAATANNAEMLEGQFTAADKLTNSFSEHLDVAAKKITTILGDADEDVASLVDSNVAKLSDKVQMLRSSLSDLNSQSETEDERVTDMIARITAHITERSKVLSSLDEASSDRTAKLAFAVEALVAATGELNNNLDHSGAKTETLSEKSTQLFDALTAIKSEFETALPEAIASTESRMSGSFSSIEAATHNAMALGALSDDVLVKLTTIEKLIATQKEAANELITANSAQLDAHGERAETLAAALAESRAMMDDLANGSSNDLIEALNNMRDSTKEAAEASRLILDDEMTGITERLSKQSSDSLSAAVESQMSALNEMVQKSFEQNILLSEEATQRIAAQLAEIDTLTSNLEARAQAAREGFAGMDDDNFARRMVTMTESLNSTAIDVTKILSHEVSDTSWAAYLKGDRGVFTRRAVRLLDNSEAKTIAAHYSEDPEFCEHVNRYIHDFESMMRVLLSTRDGNAIGVTLLSSDVGKLYVALAQAIERLRN